MAHFGIGNLPLLKRLEGVIDGSGNVETGDNELVSLIGQGNFSLHCDMLQGNRQIDDGLDLLLHGDKEIGVHVGVKPVKVFRGLEKRDTERPFNLSIQGRIA